MVITGTRWDCVDYNFEDGGLQLWWNGGSHFYLWLKLCQSDTAKNKFARRIHNFPVSVSNVFFTLHSALRCLDLVSRVVGSGMVKALSSPIVSASSTENAAIEVKAVVVSMCGRYPVSWLLTQ